MKINIVGDVGLFKNFELLNIDPFKEVSLPEANLNVGNFEFTVSNNRNKLFYDVQDQYSCSLPYLKTLFLKKFDAFGLANNHIMDYGLEGALDTRKILEENGIKTFGFSLDERYSIGQLVAEGIRIGIIACVKSGRWSKINFGYGPDPYDKSLICEFIQSNKYAYDHIIVYPHWGTELVEVPNLKDTQNAKAFIDAGATAVIGHHPHISQGIECYHNGIIAYSLGSFIYLHEEELGYTSKNTNRHVSICLNLEFTKNGLTTYKAYYYRYDPEIKIPRLMDNSNMEKYAVYLDGNIYNRRLFKEQIIKVLLKREIKSFILRFKKNPVKTFLNYSKIFLKRIFPISKLLF